MILNHILEFGQAEGKRRGKWKQRKPWKWEVKNEPSVHGVRAYTVLRSVMEKRLTQTSWRFHENSMIEQLSLVSRIAPLGTPILRQTFAFLPYSIHFRSSCLLDHPSGLPPKWPFGTPSVSRATSLLPSTPWRFCKVLGLGQESEAPEV